MGLDLGWVEAARAHTVIEHCYEKNYLNCNINNVVNMPR
jgi:hypothetical protein